MLRASTEEQRRLSFSGAGLVGAESSGASSPLVKSMTRPSTTYGVSPVVLDSAQSAAGSPVSSKKSFQSQLAAKLDKKAEEERKNRPTLMYAKPIHLSPRRR